MEALKKMNKPYFQSHLCEDENLVCEYAVQIPDNFDTLFSIFEDGLFRARCYIGNTELRPDLKNPCYAAAVEKLKKEYPEFNIRIDAADLVEVEHVFI